MTVPFDAAIAAFEPVLPLAVAFSGGADSTALLKACALRWPDAVRAIHVHHGLQAAADEFERHCRQCAQDWQVPLNVAHVDARAPAGESPEAAARAARYAALRRAAATAWPGSPVRTIALAQHADDQVETVLLALSRGAGLKGLAGMSPAWQDGAASTSDVGLRWVRPLLNVARADVEQWLRAHGVRWIEDPTNADERYTRNRLRQQVLPALATITPAWRDTFARSARHAAQAQTLLEEIAREDLARIGAPLSLVGLQALSDARLANALRAWLAGWGAAASAVQLAELMRQVRACTTRGHRIELKVGKGQVRRAGHGLVWLPVGGAAAPNSVADDPPA